jgi:hypothetical protein
MEGMLGIEWNMKRYVPTLAIKAEKNGAHVWCRMKHDLTQAIR